MKNKGEKRGAITKIYMFGLACVGLSWSLVKFHVVDQFWPRLVAILSGMILLEILRQDGRK